MSRTLTVWITPFTALPSLDAAIGAVQAQSAAIGAIPNLLLPLNFGPWPQAECTQSLPADMLVGSPADVAPIRARVEAAGVGFGGWSVPVNNDDPRAPGVAIPELCAAFAEACGYWVGNFEPGVFWRPGDDPAAIDTFWGRFWNALSDQAAMAGNVAATVVPNDWGLGAFAKSLPNLAAGCGTLCAEVYGGLQTAGNYPKPDLWPSQSFALLRNLGLDANLLPIVATANLADQFGLATRLGHGNVHMWAL